MVPFGILSVNKPLGPTSRDIVDRVERLVRPAKAGHAGTLDPLASGVLVICVGGATRLIQYVQGMPKSYRATFQLGQRSATDDIEAELVAVDGAVAPDRETLDRALAGFIGEIDQRPPAHSAVKIGGKRAYDLARKGKPVDLQPRRVSIYRIEVLSYEYPTLELAVDCGSGTYIRSLGRDLGEALGTGAVMTALDRTAIGGFRVDDALPYAELNDETVVANLLPAGVAVADMPRVRLSRAQVVEIHNGRPVLRSHAKADSAPAEGSSEFAAIDGDGRLVAILFEKLPGELWTRMNFKDTGET